MVIKNNKVHLCDSCIREGSPSCDRLQPDKVYGDRDEPNICACSEYFPVGRHDPPLINPLKIPLGWYIAMDADLSWFVYSRPPARISGRTWATGSIHYELDAKVRWDGFWKESIFSRKDVLKRWQQEYGDDWLAVAENDSGEC